MTEVSQEPSAPGAIADLPTQPHFAGVTLIVIKSPAHPGRHNFYPHYRVQFTGPSVHLCHAPIVSIHVHVFTHFYNDCNTATRLSTRLKRYGPHKH